MKEITLKITKATVVKTAGTDHVCLDVDLPTAFPEMKYVTTLVILARHDYGKEWCESALGITPEVVERTGSYRG